MEEKPLKQQAFSYLFKFLQENSADPGRYVDLGILFGGSVENVLVPEEFSIQTPDLINTEVRLPREDS